MMLSKRARAASLLLICSGRRRTAVGATAGADIGRGRRLRVSRYGTCASPRAMHERVRLWDSGTPSCRSSFHWIVMTRR